MDNLTKLLLRRKASQEPPSPDIPVAQPLSPPPSDLRCGLWAESIQDVTPPLSFSLCLAILLLLIQSPVLLHF